MNQSPLFKRDFVWGVATSAYQIEGAVAEDGRSASIWDTFCRTPGAVHNGDTGDVACDHYHRWPEDIKLLRQLGVDAYRLSIAWPRVVPDGSGAVNAAGIGFYDRLVDGLLEAGITPYVTLYHWDLPQVLHDRGGWPERDTALHFADYATAVASVLGDRVVNWTTTNEPQCSAWLGYLTGKQAPGWTDLTAAVRASHHLHLAHGLGVRAIRAAAALGSDGVRVGVVNNLSPCEPATDRDEDIAAAVRADGHVNRWWLDPITGRGYPEDMVKVYGVEVPIVNGDLDIITAPLDYQGINYYFTQVVVDDPDGAAPYAREVPVDGAAYTGIGWPIKAAGLRDILVRVAREYDVPSLYVTENGSAWPDSVAVDGSVDDPDRVGYLEAHLAAVAEAAERGAPLDGYFAWSLMDNFEWSYGYGQRFGLAYVDFETQDRIMKTSGRRYAEIIAASKAASKAKVEAGESQ